MKSNRDTIGQTKVTIEDLDIELGQGFYIGDADVTVDMQYEGYDKGDHWTPPSGGFAYPFAMTVDNVTVYNPKGDEVQLLGRWDMAGLKLDVLKHLDDTGWMDNNKDWLAEQWANEQPSREDYL